MGRQQLTMRHQDKRVRLIRVERGYVPPAPPGSGRITVGDEITPMQARFAVRRYENECHCGLPVCPWPQRQREIERGYKRHRGVWKTANGRFTLWWMIKRGGITKEYPQGTLRMWDSLWFYGTYHRSLSDARAEIIRRYEKGGRR